MTAAAAGDYASTAAGGRCRKRERSIRISKSKETPTGQLAKQQGGQRLGEKGASRARLNRRAAWYASAVLAPPGAQRPLTWWCCRQRAAWCRAPARTRERTIGSVQSVEQLKFTGSHRCSAQQPCDADGGGSRGCPPARWTMSSKRLWPLLTHAGSKLVAAHACREQPPTSI